jgi:Na+-translocating ferredoxin:NAD+ oxidoreductase RnfC subunit
MDSNRTHLLSRIRSSGVVGAGGAGFPTYKKLDAPVEHIIANGAECEPLMYKDREVMLQDQEKMLAGLSLMRRLTGASKVTIAIKRKNSDLTRSLQPAAEKLGFALHVMEDVYPAGDEFILVYDITGRRIPPGGIPLQVGVVVDNVETIVNLARAEEGTPVTEKYVTVTGAVKEAVTVVVPVGTSFRDCIDLAGGLTVPDPVVFTGGLMMGGMETDLSLPVTKTIGGLIVLPSDHPLVERKGAPSQQYTRIGHSTCDQCSLCTELCPRYILGYPIEPHKVMRSLLMTGAERDRISLWAAYCCECNVCTLFACPEKLDPKNICVDAKGRLREQKISRSKEEIDQLFREVHSARDGRQIPIAMLYQRLGVKPYDRKAHFTRGPFAPRSVTIPLRANIGAAATPSVKEGASVRKGECIGTVPDDKLGCPVHASIDGKVTAIDERGIHIASNG